MPGIEYPIGGTGLFCDHTQKILQQEKRMTAGPYITYPKSNKPVAKAEIPGTVFVSEPGQVSFGANDFALGLFRALHGHHTWNSS
jgi:hypothetical protein